MDIIDCRYRPNTPVWMETFTRNPVYEEYVKRTGFDKKPTQSLAGCAAQLASLGIGKALVSGRDIESTYALPRPMIWSMLVLPPIHPCSLVSTAMIPIRE